MELNSDFWASVIGAAIPASIVLLVYIGDLIQRYRSRDKERKRKNNVAFNRVNYELIKYFWRQENIDYSRIAGVLDLNNSTLKTIIALEKINTDELEKKTIKLYYDILKALHEIVIKSSEEELKLNGFGDEILVEDHPQFTKTSSRIGHLEKLSEKLSELL